MQEEKNRIERVLGAIAQPELIQKVLTFALSVSSWAKFLGNWEIPTGIGSRRCRILFLGQGLGCVGFGFWGNFKSRKVGVRKSLE